MTSRDPARLRPCQDMPSGPGETMRLIGLAGVIVFVPVASHKFVEALPQRGDGLILSSHPEHLFEFAIEAITRGQQFFEALCIAQVRQSGSSDAVKTHASDFGCKPIALFFEEGVFLHVGDANHQGDCCGDDTRLWWFEVNCVAARSHLAVRIDDIPTLT